MPKFAEGEQRPYLAVLTDKRQPYEELLDTEEYILSQPVHSWTEDRQQTLNGPFAGIGLTQLDGGAIEPLVLEYREDFREYYEDKIGPLKKGEPSCRTPFTPEEFDKVFGIQVNEEGEPFIPEGAGIDIQAARSIRVGDKVVDVAVIRSYERGSVKYQTVLIRDRDKKITLSDTVPEEAVQKLRKAKKQKVSGRLTVGRGVTTRGSSLAGVELGIDNLKHRLQAEAYVRMQHLTPVAQSALQDMKNGVYDVTVYSLDEVKCQAEAHEARGAEGLRLRIRFVPVDPDEKELVKTTATSVLIDRMDISRETLKPDDFIVTTEQEARDLKTIYEEYLSPAFGYEAKNIILVNKHSELSDADKAFLEGKEMVVVQYADFATGKVHYYALELWARGKADFSEDPIPGLVIKGQDGLLVFVLPEMKPADIEKFQDQRDNYRKVLMAA